MTRARKDKYALAPLFYAKGMSIAQVAELYGITRQAMHSIIKVRDVVFREQLRYGDDNHFHRGGSKMEKHAQHAVEKALKAGRLQRAPCQVCGEDPKARGSYMPIPKDYAPAWRGDWRKSLCKRTEDDRA